MKKWLYGAPLALCVVLLAAVLRQNQRFDALHTEISTLTAALERQTQAASDLREQMEALERSISQGPALTDWSVTPVSVDTALRELTVRVSVTPAEGRDIRVDRAIAHRPDVDPAENQQWPGAYSFDELTDGTVCGELTLPYAEESPVAFTVVYEEDGQRRTREIARYDSMDDLLPVRLAENWGEMGYNMSGDGRLYLVHQSVTLADGAAVEEPVYRLLKNGAVAVEAPAEPMEEPGTYSGYTHLESFGGLPCAAGDRVELRFACTDQYGLRYEFPLRAWDIVSPWQTAERWPESGVRVIWPE
ncbi:hypothetical protein [Dysosmobacter sp.]|uniref:hypothetical protein n=1 Tax=Dysosmobacter sp. TaxID=2591382 RepID=UPI002A8B1308|nr:hypothetical protein [Dysosmobacter sp.]MDY3282614.1 hypothetical protein [Dysosmobacter sp.]